MMMNMMIIPEDVAMPAGMMMIENLGYEVKINIIFGSFCFLIYSNANSIMKFISYWNASQGFFASSIVKMIVSSYPSVVNHTSK